MKSIGRIRNEEMINKMRYSDRIMVNDESLKVNSVNVITHEFDVIDSNGNLRAFYLHGAPGVIREKGK